MLLKFLDARDKLSVQVHPDDWQKKYIPAGESGKTEAWVVLQADSTSRIYAGLKPGTTPADLQRPLKSHTVADLLASFTPAVGDAVFIRAGTVHSLSGVVVFEVQENSDVTFRLYDWDRVDPKTGKPRPLQVEQAVACIDTKQVAIGPQAPLFEQAAPALRESSSGASIFQFGGAADYRRSQSVRRARHGYWSASPAKDNWSTAAPITQFATATSCSCRPRSVPVAVGHAVKSPCWRLRCRIRPVGNDRGDPQGQEPGNGKNEKARCFRPGWNACSEQVIA